MSPTDALSASPPGTISPPKPLNGNSSNATNSVATALTFTKKAPPSSPSISVSAFPLPADKKDKDRKRGSFEQTKGNWGNRIVLTTYPGQANVGPYPLMSSSSHELISPDPFPLDWFNPDPHIRGPSNGLLRRKLTCSCCISTSSYDSST